MPRLRVRKTERGLKPISAYEKAYTEIAANNTSIRCTAEKCKLHYVSLSRFVKKKKEAIEQGSAIPVSMGYRSSGNTTPNATEVVSEVSTSETLSSSINDDILRASPNNHTVPTTRSTHIPPATLSSHIPPALPSSSKALFSDADVGPSTSNVIFSPEVVRPFSKALPRKTSSKRKSRKSAIYTDTPEKNAIQEEYDLRKKKQIMRKLTELKYEQKPVQKSKNTKSKNYHNQSDSDEENCFCLVCLEPYGTSRPGEKWVQCIQCSNWSHEECTEQEDLYTFCFVKYHISTRINIYVDSPHVVSIVPGICFIRPRHGDD
ncbi:hypothetical protein JTB14_025504 [Gonioctena quinquepunctata]|nr:hypothetical protein JTB14_025504 [Gonioctena quinquepunctata]